MKAVYFEQFAQRPEIREVPDPAPPADGVVIEVAATGVCRSDWHGWMGHDPDVSLPHVPGHELAGRIAEVGTEVRGWRPGTRVTVPFAAGCGRCPECASGNHQVCPAQSQPGFTHWGSFARYVAIDHADENLVAVPDAMDDAVAATLGCRFATSFRALVAQGRVGAGDWVAVHGCGGIGLAAVMIASALGAGVIAVDIASDKLERARALGAIVTVDAAGEPGVVPAIRDATGGGAHVSVDALGSPVTCFNSIDCLRARGRHVQVGLMVGGHNHAPVPIDRIIAKELEVRGSHGMAAHAYPAMIAMIEQGRLDPTRLLGRRITLEQSIDALLAMDRFADTGITVVDRI